MKNILSILLLTMMVCCWSCSEGEDNPIAPTQKPEEKPKIEVTTSAPVLAQEGGTASVTFTSTADWTIDVTEGRAVSWCTVSPTSGGKGTNTLTITTTGNDTYDERNAKVTIKAGATTQSFTVTQKQKDGLTVTSNKVEIGCEGGNFTIEAQANVSVTYEIEESAKDWISANESRGLTAKPLNFTAKANEQEEHREGKITLKGGDGLTETVTVYQEGEKTTLVITSNDIIVGSDGETIKIELKSNVDYTMVMPEVDWISKEESRAFSAYTHYLLVAPNETYDQRSAVVFFQNEAEGLKDSISITQLQKDAIIVAKNEYTIAAEGGYLDFSVNTNVDFEVSVSVDWIKQNTGSRSLMEKPLSFIVAENDSTKSREGEIVITFKDLKQTIKVTQQGAIDYEAIERAALIEFYKAAGGDSWTNNENWCSDKPLNEWYGVQTYKNRVIALDLWNEINLKGAIPESIGNLTALENLCLWFTQINASLPESLGNLISLKQLRIRTRGNEQLIGSIPENIGNLTQLESLYLFAINLTGSIPESICNLIALEELNLGCNQLTESIPENIGNLTSLKKIDLGENQLTGSIPESIGNLTDLKKLELSGNKLTGAIPESIGNLATLEELRICNNQLTGSIPESIGNLTALKKLDLSGNILTGAIPESIGNLIALEALYLFHNEFTGSIPQSIGNLTALEQLYLGDKLTGYIPESIGNLKTLKILYLRDNQLTGSIPESIGNLTALETLTLAVNQLTGPIPESIGNLTNLKELELLKNQLTGSIPESIGNLTNLEMLNLQRNLLSGKVPFSVAKLNVWKQWWPAIIIGNQGLNIDGIPIPAPDFSVIDILGNSIISENEYNKNKMTIIYQWGTWCPYSNAFNPTLMKLYETCHQLGLEIVGSCVPISTTEEIKTFIEKNSIPWKNFIQELDNRNAFFEWMSIVPTVIAVNDKKQVIFQSITHDYNEITKVVMDYFGTDIDIYTSTDYSQDGDVVTLQTATVGKGINLTFMGEAFVDKDMASGGLYEQKMNEAMEKFFSIEPYKSLRDRFNVYAVKVVSPNAEFMDGAKHRINLSDSISFEYAQKIPNASKNPLMVSVIYNTSVETDRSYTTMYSDGSFVGYMMDGISNVLIHETGGHGFANLLDEYVEPGLENSTLSKDEATLLDNLWTTYSWGANVDWRNDKGTVKWSHFLNDSRYANEGLSLYEGAYLYGYGAYRPTENSMMRYNDSPFNAPSREQIYKRIMQLSEGENWKYDYEEFVTFDANSRNSKSRSVITPLAKAEQKEYIKNHRPPRFIKGTWRDAMKGKDNIIVPFR